MFKNKDLCKLETKNLKAICRLCLMDGSPLHEICSTKIPSMIQYCLNIKILPQDQLPTRICKKCFRQITNFYIFKRKTETSDRILKKAIRHWSISKEINTELEKADINTLELNEIQKSVKTINKNRLSLSLRTDDEVRESQNKVVDNNNIQNYSVKPNSNLGPIQRHQNSFCFKYNIEPPPLVPLHLNSDIKNNTNILEYSNTSGSNNLVNISILQPPPLVPIIALETVEGKSVSSNELSCNTWRQKRKSNCQLNNHKCNICKTTFTDTKKLVVHLNGHKNTKAYLCNVCGKKYSTRSTFIVHFRSHTGERPFNCNICGKGFIRWAGVKNHMKTHEDLKPYKCETCGKQFKVVSNLYRHQRLHTGNYTFSCRFCSKAYHQSDHLKLHIRTYHTNEKPFLCCECGKGFVSSQRLKRHERVHSGQKPYPCSLCLRAYTNAIDLKNHNLNVHEKNGNRDEIKKYACSICGLRFRHPCRLANHTKIHTDPKNCQGCGRTFKCDQILLRHLKTCKAQSSSN